MLPNAEVDALMSEIIIRLEPISKCPDACLWAIYQQLQAWKAGIEWGYPGIGMSHLAEMTAFILGSLKALPDRALAGKIERVVCRHDAPAA